MRIMSRKIELHDLDSKDFFYSEAIKTLRANIQFSGRKRRKILITSVFSAEGKSEISFQLAAEIAKTEKKVLLIDADLRNSNFQKRHNVKENMVGLSEYLSGQVDNPDMFVYATNYKDLFLIPAGAYAPNPADMLSDDMFRKILDSAAEDFDYIIIDSPPLGLVIDAATIASVCDGTLLVLESGAVSYRAARKVKQQLERTGCYILGVVLNRVEQGAGGKYGSRYGKYRKYGKYGYGYRENSGLS